MFCGWFSSSTTDRDVSEQGFPEDLPPADGQVHREESHLRVCVGGSVCLRAGACRETVWTNNTAPPLVFMPLICDLGKGAECFPEARIRLFLIKMH